MNEGEIVFMNEEARNRRLKLLYEQLGEAYYEGAFEDPLPQLLPLFDEITKVKRERQDGQLKESVQAPQIPKRCPYCHEPVEDDALFCGNCGQKIR